jgi:hypothetical protein
MAERRAVAWGGVSVTGVAVKRWTLQERSTNVNELQIERMAMQDLAEQSNGSGGASIAGVAVKQRWA